MSSKPSAAVLLSGREKFSAYFGGALARWTFEVYSRLAPRIDGVVFGYPTDKSDVYPFPHETSKAWRYCDALAKIPRIRRQEERLWLSALVRRLRAFDIVHIHNRPQWVSILRSLGYEGKILLHLQNDHLGHWDGRALDGLASHLDRVIVCSGYLRDTFAARSPSIASKTVVIFNGVNTRIFYPHIDLRESQTIFFVGRIHNEKGVLQLVRAYSRVLETHPRAKLVIGGATGFGTHNETPYVKEVRSLAKALVKEKHAKIEFAGYIHHDRDLPSWFQRATVFTSPSLFQEPFGLVNAEAMACSTPVVGSNRGGIPEVLGDTGILIDPEDIDTFSAAISELIGNPSRCTELGQAAYSRCVRMFDWDVVASAFECLLMDVCGRYSS